MVLKKIEKNESRDAYWTFRNMMIEAHEALDRDLRGRAMAVWFDACNRYPDAAIQSEPAFDFLLKCKRFDEAEKLLSAGLKRFPSHVYYREGLALIAYKRGDLPEALHRCALLRKAHPGSVKGYGIAAAALSELGRSEEAESLLAGGLRAIPDDAGLWIEHAKLAERRGDWEEALARWTVFYERFNHLAGVAGSAICLAELRRYDEADSLLAGVMYKVGNDLSIWMAYVQVAQRRLDWAEADRRWNMVRKRFPLMVTGYVNGLEPLLRMARFPEADAIVLEGIDRMPEEIDLQIEYALLPHRRGDWGEAAQRWALLRERFPHAKIGYERGAEALGNLGQTDAAARLRDAATVM